MTTRRGMSLLIVVVALASLSVVAMGSRLTVSAQLTEAGNRAAAQRSEWLARGCAEVVRAALAEQHESSDEAAKERWRHLDTLLTARIAGALPGWCDLEVLPRATTLNINAMVREDWERLLAATGTASDRVDALIDAILAHRDSASFDDPREIAALSRAYGVESRAAEALLPMLGTDRERLVIGRTSSTVLALLPGVTARAAAVLSSASGGGPMLPDDEDSLRVHRAELLARTTTDPDAWRVRITSATGQPRIAVRLSLRITRTGSAASVMIDDFGLAQ